VFVFVFVFLKMCIDEPVTDQIMQQAPTPPLMRAEEMQQMWNESPGANLS